MTRFARVAALLAAGVWLLATLIFGAALDGYSQLQHPLALLGARGIDGAGGYNLLGFVVPGVLAAFVAYTLRSGLPAGSGWSARIGVQLLVLAALAFAAQGWWSLEPSDIEGGASALHVSMWTLWWVALLPAGPLLAIGLRGGPAARLGAGALAMVACVLGFGLFAAPLGLPAGLAQRAAFAAWLGWMAWAGWSTRPATPP